MSRLWHPRYFVITLLAVALAVLGVRLESLAQSLFYGRALETIARATAEDVAVDEDVRKGDADAAKPEDAAQAEDDGDAVPPPASVQAPPSDDMSEGELDVLKQLSGRRAQLDRREQEIRQKGAILQAAEMRVDRKVRDMEKLRSQLQGMLGQVSEEQQAQAENLVKIYEVMKPKEAARILQTLDMPVLLGVMRAMKPAKSAPILAEMDAAKAKDVTMTLSRQHDLPDTKAAH